jgi:hypothetical protein
MTPVASGAPEEVLDIEGLLGEIGQDHAGRERLAPAPDDRDARYAGVLRGKAGELLADAGGFVELESRRLGSWVVFRHCCAAGDQQDGSGQQGAAPANFGARAIGSRVSRFPHDGSLGRGT